MKRASSINSMLERTEAELKRIAVSYQDYIGQPDVRNSLKIDIHDFLAHNRAVLDYLAEEIADVCVPKPMRPQFPIASYTKDKLTF